MQDREIHPLFISDCAAVALQSDFSRVAAHLRRWDPALQDDLVQEMSLGVLQCEGQHTLSFFRTRGISRAKDFLRMWRRRSMQDLSAIKEAPLDRAGIDIGALDTMLEKTSGLMGINVEDLKTELRIKTCA